MERNNRLSAQVIFLEPIEFSIPHTPFGACHRHEAFLQIGVHAGVPSPAPKGTPAMSNIEPLISKALPLIVGAFLSTAISAMAYAGYNAHAGTMGPERLMRCKMLASQRGLTGAGGGLDRLAKKQFVHDCMRGRQK
jgi:hypothetical protein